MDADQERIAGEHPDTAIDLNNLGLLLKAQGDLAGAYRYYERALRINEQVLGEGHPATARSLNNLAMLLAEVGDLPAPVAQAQVAEARAYLERALRIFEAKLGPDHPDTRTVRNNLASLDA